MTKELMSLSDVDTRRRAACDLVRALSKSFEGPVIQNFSTYVQAMLQVQPMVKSPAVKHCRHNLTYVQSLLAITR